MSAMASASAVGLVVASAMVVASAAVSAASASALGWREFFGGGVAHHFYFAVEAHCLVDERVVEVHFHMCGGHFRHEAVDAVGVGRP